MNRLIFALVTLFALALSSVAARADVVTLTLTSPSQETSAGRSLLFEATVSAPMDNLTSVYLNGSSHTLFGGLAIDDSGFFDFPLFLQPGESFTGLLFKIDVPADLPTGIYANSFSIMGGADGAVLDTLATVRFNVSVVPEPSTVSLVMAAALLALARSRKKVGGRSFNARA